MFKLISEKFKYSANGKQALLIYINRLPIVTNYKQENNAGYYFQNVKIIQKSKHKSRIQGKQAIEIVFRCREIIIHYKLRLDKEFTKRIFSTQK